MKRIRHFRSFLRSLTRRDYIQVAYLLASEETTAREFAPYDAVRDNCPKYVLSLDEFDMRRDGIKHCNIRDFLRMDTW